MVNLFYGENDDKPLDFWVAYFQTNPYAMNSGQKNHGNGELADTAGMHQISGVICVGKATQSKREYSVVPAVEQN